MSEFGPPSLGRWKHIRRRTRNSAASADHRDRKRDRGPGRGGAGEVARSLSQVLDSRRVISGLQRVPGYQRTGYK
eukprot:3692359-Rhodomonas_salina.1